MSRLSVYSLTIMEGRVDLDRMAQDQMDAVASGDPELAAGCVHPDNVNHMAAEEPPACATPGVPGLLATSAWLRLAFTDIRFEAVDTVATADRIIWHGWMSARQTGPFVVFPAGGRPVSFPPTDRQFAVRQCHVFLVRDGLLAEHTAVRDDLGMMNQLGHLPPSPPVMLGMARWRLSGGHRRAVASAVARSEEAAEAARVSPQRTADELGASGH